MAAPVRPDHLAAILELAHEAFISIDDHGVVRAWNREAELTFGWARDDAIGRLLRELIIPERYRGAHDAGLRRFRETGEGPLLDKRVEISALHRDGHEFPVELTITPLELDGAWTFHAFVHDISDRYRANELQVRLATIVEHSADAIIGRTREGVVTSWNPAATSLYGYTADEMIGRRLDALVPRDRRGEAEDLFQRALAGEAIHDFETQRCTKDGRVLDVSISLSPIRDVAGVVSDVATIHRDVSARKEIERRLIEANEELRRANELTTQLVAVASHELRTPLTVIAGFVTTLLVRWGDLSDDDRRRYLEIVREQTGRLTRLVDDVLLLSRVEATGGSKEPEARTDVAAVAAAVARALPGRFEVVAPDQRVFARTDRDHVYRIILNFAANALAHGAPPFEIEVSADIDFVQISVSDAGEGVPPTFAGDLFRAFAQAAPGREGSSGLGLAIVRSLVESAGGEAWYVPNKPHGARFCAHLPRAG